MPRAKDTTIRRVGSVRPSQLLYSFGIGSIIDLPSFSVLVGGLDEWDANRQQRLSEERLLGAVRARPRDGERAGAARAAVAARIP